ncbi:TPA: PQQ-binding-like beta-propeller repeat protein, partial [archaeon]|nr:PQQ-binding-like beta-propeller repeat protein [Candidatus Naiadarchaeum limnaeum]
HNTGGELSYLLALNKTNGQQLWRYNFSDVNQFPERVLPVYYGDKIVVSTTDFSNSKIYALNATTGTLIWQYDVTGEDMWSGPSVADSKVVFGTGAGQKVYALSSLNGSLLWTVNAGNSVYSTPALIDDAVYIGVDGGKVLRLRANTTHSNENVQFTAGQVTTVDGVMNSDISVDIHATSSGTGEMHLRKYPMPPNTTNAFGETKLGKYMKITHQNVLNNMDWAVIKLFYTDDDIVALELNESALALLRWNGSAWTCPSTCGVNTVDNYAWINTTSFSTFGMSGGMPSQGGVLEKIDALIDKVKSLDIDGGLKQSLLAKLNAARDAFLRGNIKAAINQLEAFIDEVEAQRGKKIREADADMLISMAKEIIKMLRT